MKSKNINKMSLEELEELLATLKKSLSDKKVIINSLKEQERELQKELNRLYNQKIK